MIRLLLAAALAIGIAGAQEVYDLLLKNGTVIDPANHRNGRFDVAIASGKIARVGLDVPGQHARITVDAGAYYVVPGLIDLLVHSGGVGLEYNSFRSGVTTVVDAEWKAARTLKLRRLGWLTVDDTSDPAAVAGKVRQSGGAIVGIRTHTAIDRAVLAAEAAKTIVMADAGYAIDRLRPGDIATHIFGPANAADLFQGALAAAGRRGVGLDTGKLDFRTARSLLKNRILPETISTDMDEGSILLTRTDMATTLSKFLSLGVTVEQLFERTTANPARLLRRPDLGTLSPGAVADVALFALENGTFGFLDANHLRLAGARRLRCALTVRNGVVVWDRDGLVAPDWIQAGPYSNFR